jgi:hypothetical protein
MPTSDLEDKSQRPSTQHDNDMLNSICCGAENISFGSGSTEPQIRIVAPISLQDTLKITFFD